MQKKYVLNLRDFNRNFYSLIYYQLYLYIQSLVYSYVQSIKLSRERATRAGIFIDHFSYHFSIQMITVGITLIISPELIRSD